ATAQLEGVDELLEQLALLADLQRDPLELLPEVRVGVRRGHPLGPLQPGGGAGEVVREVQPEDVPLEVPRHPVGDGLLARPERRVGVHAARWLLVLRPALRGRICGLAVPRPSAIPVRISRSASSASDRGSQPSSRRAREASMTGTFIPMSSQPASDARACACHASETTGRTTEAGISTTRPWSRIAASRSPVSSGSAAALNAPVARRRTMRR